MHVNICTELTLLRNMISYNYQLLFEYLQTYPLSGKFFRVVASFH